MRGIAGNLGKVGRWIVGADLCVRRPLRSPVSRACPRSCPFPARCCDYVRHSGGDRFRPSEKGFSTVPSRSAVTTTVIPAKAGIHFHPPVESAAHRHSLRADTAYRRCAAMKPWPLRPVKCQNGFWLSPGMTAKTRNRAEAPFPPRRAFSTAPHRSAVTTNGIQQADTGSGRPQGAAPTDECDFVRHSGVRPDQGGRSNPIDE